MILEELRRTILVVSNAPTTIAARTPAATRYAGAPTAPSTPPTTPAITRSETNVTSVASRETHGQSVRSPRSARIAGSRVIDASSDISVTKIAPAARLRKIVVGRMNMPISARTTVMPLKNTARLAVAPAGADRLELREPLLPLLAVPGHDEQRIVDPDREADHRDHVLTTNRLNSTICPIKRDESHRERDRGDRHERRERGRRRPRRTRPPARPERRRCRSTRPSRASSSAIVVELGEQGRLSGHLGREAFRSMLGESSRSPSTVSTSSAVIATGRSVAVRFADTRPAARLRDCANTS